MTQATALFYPMLSHVLLVGLLYIALTIARAPAVWGLGKRQDGSNPFAAFEPRISANLSNQFEWPLFFYAICLLQIVLLKDIHTAQIVLAWCFIIGRVLHTLVQVSMDNIRLRGAIFTVNFLAVLGMWALVANTIYS